MSGYLSFFESEDDRKQLARLLNGLGRGVNARIDVPMVVLNDVKWAATVFEDLAKVLTKLSFDDERPEVYRVLAARWAMDNAKVMLHSKNKRTESLDLQRKVRARRP